jgi:hypothetical protein
MGKDRRHEKTPVSLEVVGNEVPVGFGEVTIAVLPISANQKAAS